MSNEIIKRANEIIAENTGSGTYCTLALIDTDGYPTASTITAAKSDGINWVTFCTGLGGRKANRIKKCGRAAVCFNTGGNFNITLVGVIEIVTDETCKKEMWYSGLEEHFTGPEDPNFCVLRFKTERYKLFVDWQPEVEGRL
ncbi:MAG: pyridoxamine 5'-phosphate oxidase family protein [Defluviitaleaceae bacterium]|nr:pyridoxamine 5'-phosphate oxidase family protein [Defluviitaleaceae bacterium]MCL2836460.1 pyridoxamine 5'-phosphate oxidase family protein [Defluviitaleaceae bacterium]